MSGDGGGTFKNSDSGGIVAKRSGNSSSFSSISLFRYLDISSLPLIGLRSAAATALLVGPCGFVSTNTTTST